MIGSFLFCSFYLLPFILCLIKVFESIKLNILLLTENIHALNYRWHTEPGTRNTTVCFILESL